VTSVLSAAIGHDGGGGLGILLPAVILVGVLGVVARIVRRRRTS
jgi:hypothetical protein